MSTNLATLPENFNDWLTKQQAAVFLNVAEKTIERMAARGQIHKSIRKRPGLPPLCVYHGEDLSKLKAEEQRRTSFAIPPLDPFVRALNAIVDRVTAPPTQLALPAPAGAPEGPLQEPHFLSLKQAREVSGLPPLVLRQQFIERGRALRTGRGWRISRADLERFARSSDGRAGYV